MTISTLARFAAPLLIFAGMAQAVPLREYPQAFPNMSRTAGAITGPVIASKTHIIFGNGAQADMTLLGEHTAEWDLNGKTVTGQVFRVSQDPGELMNGNRLCSADDPVTHLVVFQNELFGMWSLTIAAFRGEAVPTSINEPTLCGTYGFGLDGEILGDSSAEPAAEPQPEPVEEDPIGNGKWSINRSTNPIDDTKQVTLHIQADSGESRMGERVSFVARCKSNSTEAYAIWHDYVGDDSSSPYEDYKYVTVRLGDAPSERQRWGISTDKQATFAPDWAGGLLKRMVGVDQMILQLTPYGENPVTAIFDIRGLREPLTELSQTCNWSF